MVSRIHRHTTHKKEPDRRTRPTGKEIDLWKRMELILKEMTDSKERAASVVAAWTKGHATREIVETNLVLEEDRHGNDEASKRAVHG